VHASTGVVGGLYGKVDPGTLINVPASCDDEGQDVVGEDDEAGEDVASNGGGLPDTGAPDLVPLGLAGALAIGAGIAIARRGRESAPDDQG
jgi:hypothetical protein